MSKSNDPQNENKVIPKAYGNMSSRQQIIYIKNKTQKETEWTIDKDIRCHDDEKTDEPVDSHQVFLEQKEKFRKSVPKHILSERNRYIKQSYKDFSFIRKNIYLDRKKYPFTDEDAFVCLCEKPTPKRNETYYFPKNSNYPDISFACGKACINRMVSWECVENLCPSGPWCRNRRFQLHEYSEVYPVPTKDRGWGLFAGEPLPKGTFVMQYIGEIYSIDSEIGIQKIKQYRNKTCTYLMSISKNEVIDPTFKGNLARFINHSCDPNCETQKWHVLGEVCVGIFTLKDVNEGEELTFNYGFDIMKTTFQKCLCKSKNCKGYLGVAQNDVTAGIQNILCAKCNRNCKNNDQILVCEKCKKIFHRTCLKSKSIQLIDVNHYFCKSCTGKSEKKLIREKTRIKKGIIEEDIEDKNSEIKNVIQSLKEASKSETTEKFIPQNPIEVEPNHIFYDFEDVNRKDEDYKIVEDSQIISNEKIEKKEFKDQSISQKSEDQQSVVMANVSKYTSVLNEDIKDDSNEKIDEVFEVDDTQLKIILKNLRSISRYGARFFWEKNRQLNDQKIELKISGTKIQNENVIQAIKKIFEENRLSCENISLEMSVPKIFLRKIIGHQSRNLNSYKSKHNVEIDYDINLITDDIFPINETTIIKIAGNEKNVRIVEDHINHYLFNLKVMTIFMLNNDYLQLKNSICQLKNLADPADLRLRKKETKSEKEIKHSFYYIPNSNRDLVIIGFEKYNNNKNSEIAKGEKIVKEFLLRQNILENNYSLCFLSPIYLSNTISNFKLNFNNILKDKNVIFRVYDPNYSRKHLNLYLEGKWKDIVDVKNMLFKFFDSNNKSSCKKNSIDDFQQYTYNQEMKLISKNIRKSFLEPNYIVKNWDLITPELNFDDDDSSQRDSNIKSNHLLKFLQNTDRDTVLNHLLYLPPSSYNSVFGLGKKHLVSDLIEYLEEAYDSYCNLRNLVKNNDKKDEINLSFKDNQLFNCKSNFWTNEISFQQLSNNQLSLDYKAKSFSPKYDFQNELGSEISLPKGEKDIDFLQHYKFNHNTSVEDKKENFSNKILKNDFNLVENVIKIDFVRDDKIDQLKLNMEHSQSCFSQSNNNLPDLSKNVSDRDFIGNKRKLQNNTSPNEISDDEKNKFYHTHFFNKSQNTQPYNYGYGNNDKVTQQIYIINNYNLSGNPPIINEKPSISSVSLIEKKNINKSDSESSNIYSKVVEEKSESRNIFTTRPKFSTRFQHYYKSISSSKSDHNNNRKQRKHYKRSKLRKTRKSNSSSQSSSKSKSEGSMSRSKEEKKLEEGLLSKKSIEEIQDKHSSKSKSNKRKNKRLKRSRSISRISNESLISNTRQRLKFNNKAQTNIQRMSQDNYPNKSRFNYNPISFSNSNSFFQQRDNRIRNYYDKDFYHNKFKSGRFNKTHGYFERKPNTFISYYPNRYNKSGFYNNKYNEKKERNREYRERRKSILSDRSMSPPSNKKKSNDEDSIKSNNNKNINNDSSNEIVIDEKEKLLTEYHKLKNQLSKKSPSSQEISETEGNPSSYPILIKSSLKNPYKI